MCKDAAKQETVAQHRQGGQTFIFYQSQTACHDLGGQVFRQRTVLLEIRKNFMLYDWGLKHDRL